jgi:tRNA pseudouridine38-40 synthase
MRNIKLLIEYDGTNYAGWQRQKNAISLQQTLENSIKSITGEKIEATGCSRTDSGVHAKGFVCNFYTCSTIPEDKYREAINSKLPQDIIVLKSEEVVQDFHARYSCVGKTYSYTVLNREVGSALMRNTAYHYKYKLDMESMRRGAEHIIGTHDFSAFRNLGSSVKTTVRTVTKLDLQREGQCIKFLVSADGFLYNMVRIIVGTLLQVGIGKISSEEVKFILESGDRSFAGPSVPPQGLCLEEVNYNI